MSLLTDILAGIEKQFTTLRADLPKPDTAALSAITAERDALALKVAAFENDAPTHAKTAADLKTAQEANIKLSADLAKKAEIDKAAFDAAVAEGVAKVSAERGIKPLPVAAATDPASGEPAKPALTGLARTIAAFKLAGAK